MLAGTLYGAGYFMGNALIPASQNNPKGYYEAFDIESINEDLIERVTPKRPKGILENFFKNWPERKQRWLVRLPVGKKLNPTSAIEDRMKAVTVRMPYCFKDPRFCYTLPVWRPFLNNTVFLCIFRHPSDTAESIIHECQTLAYLKNLSMTFNRALDVWKLMYRHILEAHIKEGDWLFVHYNQMFQEEVLDKIETFIDAKIDRSFPDKFLQRHRPRHSFPNSIQKIYGRLCALAHFEE